jgi:hypothetical protein
MLGDEVASVRDRPKMRQSGPLSGWPYIGDRDHAALVGILRGLRPWTRSDVVRNRLHAWTRANVDRPGCQDVADEIARIGRAANLLEWSDDLVADVVHEMLHNVSAGRQPWEHLGGSLLDDTSLPRSTRYRHREDGMDYLYQRRSREATLRALVVAGRSEAAARRWMQRHPGKRAGEAPPPQSRHATSTRSGSKRVAPGFPGPIDT